MTQQNQTKETDEIQKYYMNIHSGIVDTYDGWFFQDDYETWGNYVDLGEVVEVELINGEWIEKEY